MHRLQTRIVMSAKKKEPIGVSSIQNTAESGSAFAQIKNVEHSPSPVLNVKPKVQKHSRFFCVRQFSEKRSRSVAPADSTTYSSSPPKRRKATDGGTHIREASALRRHYQYVQLVNNAIILYLFLSYLQ